MDELSRDISEIFPGELSIPNTASKEDVIGLLAFQIEKLIDSDFGRLVSILYRVDVSEKKLRDMLKQSEGKDAAYLIANLIIERQLQKIKSRNSNFNTPDIPDEDKW